MEDAYTIGIRLLLEDSVSAGLASIQSELASVDQAIASTTGRLAVLRATVIRPASPETPVLPVMKADVPSDKAAATESSALPAFVPAAGAAAPAAPAPLPPQPAVQDVAAQVPIVPAAPGFILPMAQPAAPPTLSTTPVYAAPSSQSVVEGAGAEPGPAVGQLRDPAIFAPRSPAPMLPVPLPMPPGLPERDPGRPIAIAAAAGVPSGMPLLSGAREIVPVIAPVSARVEAVAIAVPAAPVPIAAARHVASPIFRTPQVASAPIVPTSIPRIVATSAAPLAIPKTDAVPAAPIVVPAVLPAAPESNQLAFAPPAVVQTVVSASAAIAPAVDAVLPTAPTRPATPRAEQDRQISAERQQEGHREIVPGDIYLDGARLGRWIRDHLAREVSRPQAGTAAFDPTLSPSWPGALQGS